MNKYQEAIEVIDTLLHLMCGEEREDRYKPTMEETSNSMDLLKELANKAYLKHEEMTAREMFKSLGYKYSRNYIEYYGDEVIEYYKTEGVKFVFLMKEHEFYGEYYEEPKNITVDEFKAIHQQIKELGWI